MPYSLACLDAPVSVPCKTLPNTRCTGTVRRAVGKGTISSFPLTAKQNCLWNHGAAQCPHLEIPTATWHYLCFLNNVIDIPERIEELGGLVNALK